MECEKCRLLLMEYQDEVLDADLRRQVEEHLAGCEACRTVQQETIQARELYRRYILAASPAPDFAARVMRRLAEQQRLPSLPRVTAMIALLLWVALAAAMWAVAPVWVPFLLVGYDIAGRLLPVPAIVLAAFPLLKALATVVLALTLVAATAGMRRLILS